MKFIKRAKKPRLGMKSILTFGKHKGRSVKFIMQEEPSYLEWCLLEEIFSLNTYTKSLLDQHQWVYLEEDFLDPLWD